MNKKHLILILLAALSVTFVLAGTPGSPAQAAGEPSGFKSVQLWIYPEYDDPRLLVMLEGEVEGVDIPATVRFLVPAAAEMYSAGSIDAQGNYSGGPPRRVSSSLQGWDEISYEVTSSIFRMEYYDPIIPGQPDKTVAYEFHALYAINQLSVLVQEPRSSSNFSVLPAADSTLTEELFKYHKYYYPTLDREQSLRFDISYTKSDPNPSLMIEDGSSSNVPLIIGLVAGFSALAIVGIIWVARSKPRRRPAPARAGRSSPAGRGKGELSRGKFCTQCGHRLDGSPRFCPECGNKLQ